MKGRAAGLAPSSFCYTRRPMPHPSRLCTDNRRVRAPCRCVRAIGALVAAVALGIAPGAAADICKYQDTEGRIHYSNLPPEKGWKRISCTDTDDGTTRKSASSGGTSVRSATPAGFPKVDTQTQKGRDDMRRKVLTDELGIEEKLLAEARKGYADGAPPPLPEEKNDADKYRERIARLRQTLTVHEKNVEAIKKELASTR